MSAYRVTLKTRFGNVEKRDLKNALHLYRVYFQNALSNAFCYIQQSEFRSVKQSHMYRDSIQDCNIDLST